MSKMVLHLYWVGELRKLSFVLEKWWISPGVPPPPVYWNH